MTRRSPVRALLLAGCAALTMGGVSGCADPAAAEANPPTSARPVWVDASTSAGIRPSPVTSGQPAPQSPSPTGGTATPGNPPTPPDHSGGQAGATTPPAVPAGGTGPAGSVVVTGSAGVALTFDDGPDPVNTPKLLDELKRNDVKATFCLVGFRVRDNPDLVRRIAAEGHTLCNHSWQHRFDLGRRGADDIRWDLTQTNNAIHAAVPNAPIRYFRAPGGNFTPALVQVAREFGMISLYWKVDPRDWDNATYGTAQHMVDHVVSAVQNSVQPGAIVLSHDNKHPESITAYATLLPWLKARFNLVALPT